MDKNSLSEMKPFHNVYKRGNKYYRYIKSYRRYVIYQELDTNYYIAFDMYCGTVARAYYMSALKDAIGYIDGYWDDDDDYRYDADEF